MSATMAARARTGASLSAPVRRAQPARRKSPSWFVQIIRMASRRPGRALIFLAFDMEMIFMYPWAVVFAEIGWSAFLDMLVFIVLLSAGIAYAWGMGGLEWE